MMGNRPQLTEGPSTMNKSFPAIYDFSVLPYALGDVITWSIKTAIRASRANCSTVNLFVCTDKNEPPAHFRVLTSTRRIIDFSSGISIQYSSFILSPTSTRSSTTDLPSKKRFMHVTQSKRIPSFRLISYNILKHTKVGFALNPCENIMSRKFPYTPISTNTTFKTWKSLD